MGGEGRVKELQDVTGTLLAVPPLLRHLHPLQVVRSPHMCVKGSLVHKHLIQTDCLGICSVLEHLIADAAGLAVAPTGVETNVPHEIVEVGRFDLVDAEDAVH